MTYIALLPWECTPQKETQSIICWVRRQWCAGTPAWLRTAYCWYWFLLSTVSDWLTTCYLLSVEIVQKWWWLPYWKRQFDICLVGIHDSWIIQTSLACTLKLTACISKFHLELRNKIWKPNPRFMDNTLVVIIFSFWRARASGQQLL